VRYFTYKLVFLTTKYGYGPEPRVAESGSSLVASSFVNDNGTHLGYVTGDLNVSVLAAWQAQELSKDEALAFAQELNPEAFWADDETISVPNTFGVQF
jgi:branched-subunit amino acid aminotransferase/4-amino-4-deoxychorismate lyase